MEDPGSGIGNWRNIYGQSIHSWRGRGSYIGIENSMYRNIPAEILGAKRSLKYIIDKYKCKETDMVVQEMQPVQGKYCKAYGS